MRAAGSPKPDVSNLTDTQAARKSIYASLNHLSSVLRTLVARRISNPADAILEGGIDMSGSTNSATHAGFRDFGENPSSPIGTNLSVYTLRSTIGGNGIKTALQNLMLKSTYQLPVAAASNLPSANIPAHKHIIALCKAADNIIYRQAGAIVFIKHDNGDNDLLSFETLFKYIAAYHFMAVPGKTQVNAGTFAGAISEQEIAGLTSANINAEVNVYRRQAGVGMAAGTFAQFIEGVGGGAALPEV